MGEINSSTISHPSPERLREDVQHLKEWLAQEPLLPNIDDDEWLSTFLYNNKFSLERTKQKLDNYYFYRSKYPNVLMLKRDPLSPEVLQARKALRVCALPRLSKDGCKFVYATFDPDPEILNATEVLKRIFIMADTLNLEQMRLAKATAIADCSALTYRHYLKLVPILPAFRDIIINGHTERIKAMYFINVSRWMYELIGVLKRCVPATLSSRIHAFSSPDESFRKEFHEDDLSIDYGGKGPSLQELDVSLQNMMEKHRQWFLEQENVCSKKPLRKQTGDMDDMQGSFRQLNID